VNHKLKLINYKLYFILNNFGKIRARMFKSEYSKSHKHHFEEQNNLNFISLLLIQSSVSQMQTRNAQYTSTGIRKHLQYNKNNMHVNKLYTLMFFHHWFHRIEGHRSFIHLHNIYNTIDPAYNHSVQAKVSISGYHLEIWIPVH